MLRLIYALGWLPALFCAALARPATGPSHVLSGAGAIGLRAGLGLGCSLLILSAAYIAAIARPPTGRTLVTACFASLLVALAMPVLFSADVYAYAYYGDLALHGRSPYGHAAVSPGDPLAVLAVAAWDGQIPPRCVYGPAAVAIASLADALGAVGGATAEILAQRFVAAGAYAALAVLVLRATRDPRARAAFLLNPVIIWSVAEGHNDAATVALVYAGLATGQRCRARLFALAALVKIPALAAFGSLARTPAALVALGIALAGYLPLAIALATAAREPGGASSAAAWQSPLGLLAAFAGRVPAVAIALALLGLAVLATRRMEIRVRWVALALAAWFALPNAYPWYALWTVPLAVGRLDSIWSRALIVASIFGAARAITDAIFRAPRTFDGPPTFHGGMIALEFLPPLIFLVFAAIAARRRRSIGIAAALMLVCALGPNPSAAQSTAPGPVPGQSPNPAPSAQVAPGIPIPTVPPPQPAPTSTTTPLPAPPPASPEPLVGPTQTQTQSPSTTPGSPAATVPPPVVRPTPTPFNYVITPTPVPATSPDGPHIIEVLLNDRQIHAGGPLIVRVITSPNVVGVEARALGRFIAIPQNSPGQFSLAYTLPGGIPFWLLNRNYDIVIAAATADGRQTTVSFPMLLTR